MSVKALIFDLDGTVSDTEEIHRQAFNAAFIKLELWWDWGPERYAKLLAISGGLDRLHHYVESLKTGTAEKARLHAIVPVIHRTKSEIYAELLRAGKPPLRPGVARLITDAWHEGLDAAAVSTTASANAVELLSHHFKRGEINLVVCADEVARRKPAPDIYKRALSLLRLPADACIALEDSANGLRAARAAGLATVVAPSRWTMGQDFSGADFLVKDLSELQLSDLQRMHARTP
jgi:HAD superfamily hydrolase (TIGR01509 family)